MANITQREFKASYELAKQVYKKEGSDKEVSAEAIKDAVDILVIDYQMNVASAVMYISFFLHMMRGEVYKRSISQAGLRYYLENILHDYGVEQLKIFLKGLELHIVYNQNLKKPVSAPGLCTIHTEYSKKAGMPPIF